VTAWLSWPDESGSRRSPRRAPDPGHLHGASRLRRGYGPATAGSHILVDVYRASRGTIWSGADFGNERNHVHTWGTTAQGVYKLGDTVQYKVYVRDQNNLSLAPVAERSGYELSIEDPPASCPDRANIKLSDFGG